jgi:hypothetical protein
MARLRFLTVRFNDNTHRRFSFPEQAAGAGAQQVKLSSFFNDRMVILQADGRLHVFPFENVKAVELSAEEGLLEGIQIPPHAILGASEVS